MGFDDDNNRGRVGAEPLDPPARAATATAPAPEDPVVRTLRSCGVPPRKAALAAHGQLDHEGWDAMQHARAWLEDWRATRDRPFLLLLGDPNAGKSTALAWLLHELYVGRAAFRPPLRSGQPANPWLPRWLSAEDLHDLPPYGAQLGYVADHDGPIVIDDLGAQVFVGNAEPYVAKVERIVARRYDRGDRVTLVSTNLSWDATLTSPLYARVARRIRELGHAAVCAVPPTAGG